MTAFLDSRFTSAESRPSALGPSATPWSNPELAVGGRFDGAATSVMGAGTFGPSLFLLGSSVALPGDARITGLQARIWGTSTTAGGFQPVYIDQFLTLGTRRETLPGVGLALGPTAWVAGDPPTDPQEFGSSTSVGEFKALTLSQVRSNVELEISFFNNTGASRTCYIWDAELRFWLDLPSMQDVVQRAYRKLAILSKDTEIEGDDLTYGLQSLNDMLFGWEIYGVNIGHQERVAGEAFPIARKYVEATAMQLAERLSPDYQVPAMASQRFFAALQRDYNAGAETDYRDLDGDGTVSDAEAAAAKQAEFY